MAKEGIAFILNKEMVNGMKWNHSIIIEGRASRLEIEMGREKGLNIILIYAPNGNKDKIEFWNELNTKLRRIENLENVIIMGDFNAVKESIDRYPHREEDEKVQDAWKKVAKGLKVIDGWRMHNPTKTEYTYIQKATNSMSRIDRIYMNKSIYLYGYNWNHIETPISDHEMTTVDLLKEKLPFIGKGVWRMYQDDIDNKKTMKRITERLNRTKKDFKESKDGINQKNQYKDSG